MLKEMGIAYILQDRDLPINPVLPRIIIKHPRPGYLHAFEKSDVLQILNFVGAEAIYGLRSIELVQQTAVAASGLQPFGQLIVPGRIKVFEQPEPPWRLQGLLPQEETNSLQRAGAYLEVEPEIMATFIHWSEESLRNFMIFEVLLHEIGHHILQHNTGKRTKRVVRTRDHEAFATRFVERYRTAWFDKERFD